MAQNDKDKVLYNGMKKQDCSNEDWLGAKKDKVEAADKLSPKFDDLETRVKKLKALYKYQKERKEMKENGDRESCGSS